MRNAELALDFHEAHRDVMRSLDRCTETVWERLCEAERWPVGVVFNHIADGYRTYTEWIRSFLDGRPVELNREQLDADNAKRAGPAAARSLAQTRGRLEEGAAEYSELVNGLSAEQLSIRNSFAWAGQLSVEQLCELAERHTRRHLVSAQAALDSEPS